MEQSCKFSVGFKKHARRLIIPRNCTVCSELSWTREHDEAHTQWTARHARFRTTLSGDTSRKTAHRSTSKPPLHAAAQIDQLVRKFQPQNKKSQKISCTGFSTPALFRWTEQVGSPYGESDVALIWKPHRISYYIILLQNRTSFYSFTRFC